MLRVVLADDEKKVLLLMRKLIDWEDLGFEIVGIASDGISALDQVREKKPHLLVTDIRMPGCDGIDSFGRQSRFSRDCILSSSAATASLNMRRMRSNTA